MEKIKENHISEIKPNNKLDMQRIAPVKDIGIQDALSKFDSKMLKLDVLDGDKTYVPEGENLDKLVKDYIKDLIKVSPYPETIDREKLYKNLLEIKKPDAQTVKDVHDEFNKISCKERLRKEWEQTTGKTWPKYDKDVYITNKRGEKVLFAKKGTYYDIHHKIPVALGGKNEVTNITPISAENHRLPNGIHAKGSACDKLMNNGGIK